MNLSEFRTMGRAQQNASQWERTMITKFATVYAGHIDLPDRGQDATPANERRFSNEQLAGVFDKTEAIAKVMDETGWDTLWLAEHHFQHEGYEVIPNLLMAAVHLCHLTKNLKIGCGFNITPMWHPLRLAEDFACADIMTKGRTIFGVGRGYHTREVETFGAPMLDQNANRELFEEQVEIIFKAFNNERFSHKGKHYTLPPEVPYRGYTLKDLTLVPRPVHLPVECWQPVVSASARGLDFMVKHGIKGAVGGGAATMEQGPITAYREAAAHRAGKDWKLGENLMIGIVIHLADTEGAGAEGDRAALRRARQDVRAAGLHAGHDARSRSRRSRGAAAGTRRACRRSSTTSSWAAGSPARRRNWSRYLKNLEARYPGLEHINLSTPMGTPQSIMLDQYRRVSAEVMPHFRR